MSSVDTIKTLQDRPDSNINTIQSTRETNDSRLRDLQVQVIEMQGAYEHRIAQLTD